MCDANVKQLKSLGAMDGLTIKGSHKVDYRHSVAISFEDGSYIILAADCSLCGEASIDVDGRKPRPDWDFVKAGVFTMEETQEWWRDGDDNNV